MLSLRVVWIAVILYLSAGPILSPLPLLGCVGGFTKLLGYMSAGPLLVLHGLLFLAYLSAEVLELASRKLLYTPLTISSVATLFIVTPAMLQFMTCSPDWITDIATVKPHTTSMMSLLSPLKGASWATWVTLPSPCKELLDYPNNVTSIFKDSLPAVGPSSLDSPFFNPIASIVFNSFGDHTQETLKTVYFPATTTDNNNKKPGIMIFVHGGGWWSGMPEAPPGPCIGQFAFSHGWAYAIVEYRLGRSGWSGDVQVEDVKDGIRHILQKHDNDVDTSRVVVIGSSAGANLALSASYQLNNERANLQNPVIQGVVAIAPSTSVKIGTGPRSNPKWSAAWSEAGATRRFCEGVEDCDQRLSPLEQVSKYTPRTILLHGSHDEYYTPLHSRALAQRLAEYHIPHVHMEPPLMPHCLELAENIIPYQMTKYAMRELMESL